MPPFHHSKRAAISSLFPYIKRSFLPNFIRIYIKMRVTYNYVSKFSRETVYHTLLVYSKRAYKIISFYLYMTIFRIILKEHLIKIYTNTHQIAPFFKIFGKDLLNPVMHAHLSLFEKKLQYKKVHFSQFLKVPFN